MKPQIRAALTEFFCLLAVVIATASLPAADRPSSGSDGVSDLSPGHSFHGEVFNEGPRQQAYLMNGMPKIDFPITTGSELARQFFNQGVGQLHGFWYFEAERSFRRVHQLDTNCAMAFWGMAMANVKNSDRAKGFLTNAVALKSNASKREQLYIDALVDLYLEEKDGKKRDSKRRRRDLVRALEGIVQEFPDDIEAKAFLVYQIWDNSNGSDLAISSQLAVDTLAHPTLAADPLHPAHHYRIHLWDSEKPFSALDSAARCGQGSPGIAHLWHMPGHTYAKLARHDDAAWQQEASARVDHAHMMRDLVLPDQIHNYPHNNAWLVESYSFIGRVRDAIDLAKNMTELPRLMKTNSAVATNPKANPYDFGSGSWYLGRNRLLEILPKFELWDELIALAETPYLEPTDLPDEQAKRARVLGLAWFNKRDTPRATNQIAALENVLSVVRDERQAAVDQAESNARKEKKPSDQVTKAMTDAMQRFNSRVEKIESFLAELRAYNALASRDTDTLKTQLELAKDIPKERLALIQWQAGEWEKAQTLAKEAAESATNQVQQLASYVDLLQRAGKTNEAQLAFQKLRQSRAQFDLDLPVIQRLKPIADALNLPADWRVQHPPREDSGIRPSLDSLGPLHWKPSPAPDWTLTEANGRKRSLKDYRGKPVVVIFYLGRGCAHCLEQLNAFAPKTDAFADAGISLVAVSTDSGEGLKKTAKSGSDSGSFPFPLLSDSGLKVFRSYRAYDDFEEMPLHGTFLIDGDGLVRWQDISYEPFNEAAFLLTESKRLLSISGNPKLTKKAKSANRRAG